MSGRQMPLHAILPRAYGHDLLSWKIRNISAANLIGFTTIWFIFEVVDYHFVTLLCHILMVLMLLLLTWFRGARLIRRRPPTMDEIKLSESTWRLLFSKINWLILKLYDISCGKDLKLFSVTISCLWMLSVLGTYISSLTLLYIVLLCLEIVPVLYKQHEEEMNYLARKTNRDMKRLLETFNSKVINKIPKGSVKEKKFM